MFWYILYCDSSFLVHFGLSVVSRDPRKQLQISDLDVYLSPCACAHAHEGTCVCLCAPVALEDSVVPKLQSFTFVFWNRYLTGLLAMLTWLLCELPVSPISTFAVWDCKPPMLPLLAFFFFLFHWCWRWNSGPHVCKLSPFPMAMSSNLPPHPFSPPGLPLSLLYTYVGSHKCQICMFPWSWSFRPLWDICEYWESSFGCLERQ